MNDITVFDNLFTLNQRLRSFEFIKHSYYKLGWADSSTEEYSKYLYLHSRYTDEDLSNLEIYSAIMNSEVGNMVAGLTRTKAVVNLTVPSDVNFIHTHPEKKTVLYYANVNWQEGWCGETLFFDETRTRIEFASPYTPGRVIVFDGKIPHTIRPQSNIAPHYRFTFSIFFD
jgi:hypothetical protein